MSNYVPLSVREGDWRKKAGWQIKELRHRTALRIAPWLGHDNPTPWAYEQACKALWKHRAANEELREVERAARIYFREFDHLIGDADYPERKALRDALHAEETCVCGLGKGHIGWPRCTPSKTLAPHGVDQELLRKQPWRWGR